MGWRGPLPEVGAEATALAAPGAHSQCVQLGQVLECRPSHGLDRVVVEVSGRETPTPAQPLSAAAGSRAGDLCLTPPPGRPGASERPLPGPRAAGEAWTHKACSSGFPTKALSGMALMLLLWKPLEDSRGGRGLEGVCGAWGPWRQPRLRPPGSHSTPPAPPAA